MYDGSNVMVDIIPVLYYCHYHILVNNPYLLMDTLHDIASII